MLRHLCSRVGSGTMKARGYSFPRHLGLVRGVRSAWRDSLEFDGDPDLFSSLLVELGVCS